MITMSSRRWVFTLNNPEGLLMLELEPNNLLRYYVYQEELGEEGTNHLQGYCEFLKTVRLSHLQRLIPGGHFEPARGDQKQCVDYCTKEDTRVGGPYSWGEAAGGGQGSRNDLMALKASIDAGKSLAQIFDEHPVEFFKFHRGIEKGLSLKSKVRNTDNLEVHIIGGPPGVGKSRYVATKFPQAYWKAPGHHWWDGYQGEKVVIFDDIRGSFMAYSDLLRTLDRYPLAVQTKGSMGQMLAEEFWLTTNSDPREWYEYGTKGMLWLAVKRRITHWHLLDSDGEMHTLGSWEEWSSELAQLVPPVQDIMYDPPRIYTTSVINE